jgi:hypothetical protein
MVIPTDDLDLLILQSQYLDRLDAFLVLNETWSWSVI